MARLQLGDLYIGMRVFDKDGEVGIIDECNDIHNVYVLFKTETGFTTGAGLYCLDHTCEEYTPLFEYGPLV